jgi:hypothetical protein
MAQSQRENGNMTAEQAWEAAAKERKYAISGGRPLIGSAITKAERYFVAPVEAPAWFHMVPAEHRPFVASALLESKQNRLGQNSGATDATKYAEAVNGWSLDGTGRDKDALASAASGELEQVIRAQFPDASDDAVDNTVEKHLGAFVEKHRDRLLSEGAKLPPKRTKAEKAKKTLDLQL